MTTLETTQARQQAILKKVYLAFFSPPQYEVKTADREIVERGTNYRLSYQGGELAVTTWGEGEASVLLMHGWGGARAQMTGFVQPLLSAGYRVVAYDQPAHGESDGKITNIFEIAPTMDLILEQEGRFNAIIAHSFGTIITSYALAKRNFPAPTKLVYFSAFNRLLDSLPRFQALVNLADEVITGLREMIYENFGRSTLDQIVNADLVHEINIPALMFHDIADNVTPIEDSRAIASAWKSAHFIETNGLGHRGALQLQAIHERVVDFLKNN
jgi:pimeloyl-ACP methyl ester carboxylesterase